MKKLWILTEMFYPDETSTAHILTQISEALNSVRDVRIIAIEGEISKKHPYLHIVYCKKLVSLNKDKVFQRTTQLFIKSLQITLKYFSMASKNDEVLIVTNPVFLVPFIAIASKLKKSPISVIVHDVFPENTVAGMNISQHSFIFKAIRIVFNWSYAQFKNVIVLGRDMKELFESKVDSRKTNIIQIENWADNKVKPIDKVSIVNDSKTITTFTYAGNVGSLQNIKVLVDAFKNTSNKSIVLNIYGRGSEYLSIKKFVKQCNINNVKISGSFSRKDECRILQSADICIVSLIDEMIGLGVPSKSYNILSAGKPILSIGNLKSEISLMVEENQVGWTLSMYNTEGLLRFLDRTNFEEITFEKYIKPCTSLASKKYSKDILLKKYIELFGVATQ